MKPIEEIIDSFYKNDFSVCKDIEIKSQDETLIQDYHDSLRGVYMGAFKVESKVSKVYYVDDNISVYKLNISFDKDY